MVGAEDGGVNGGGFEVREEGFGGEEVVDSPADVAVAGVGAVAPPGVVVGFIGVEVAEGVDEAGI